MRLDARQLAALTTACRLLALARFDLARRPVRQILEELVSPPSLQALPEDQAKLVSWAIAAAATALGTLNSRAENSRARAEIVATCSRNPKHDIRNPKQIRLTKKQMLRTLDNKEDKW